MWRTTDVEAILAVLRERDARVVAGAQGITRAIERAGIASSSDDLRSVGAGELIVTTPAALLATGEEPDQLVARLDAAGAGALAVALAHGRLGSELLAAADERAFPIVTFPSVLALSEVAATVLDAVMVAQGQRLETVLDVVQRFTHVVLAGGGIEEIAAVLHELVQAPVVVLDHDAAPILVVPADSHAIVDLASGVRRPIEGADRSYGELVVAAVELDDNGVLALEQAALAVAVRLAQTAAFASEQEQFAALSLEELVSGDGGTHAEIAERAMSMGWDLTRPRAVLLASIDPIEHGTIPPSALNTIAAAARATLGDDAIVWSRTTAIAALVAPASDAAVERRHIADALRRELDERLQSVTVSIGVGRRVEMATELHRSFVEASHAVDAGRWAKGRHVTEVYDELGLQRLLAATPDDDLADFVQRAIGALIDHDRAEETDFVQTLAVWLETRNMAEAARRMHVHYNTLKNRLDRIESILGPVVTDSARALECEVAIYVYRHYDMP